MIAVAVLADLFSVNHLLLASSTLASVGGLRAHAPPTARADQLPRGRANNYRT